MLDPPEITIDAFMTEMRAMLAAFEADWKKSAANPQPRETWPHALPFAEWVDQVTLFLEAAHDQ